jgi:hypothetical protein
MASTRRRVAAILAPAAMMAAALGITATASPAAASSGWQLVDEFAGHPVCYSTGGGSNYLQIDLSGSWAAPVSIGASGLPAGGSYSTYILYQTGYQYTAGSSPIPPGSSNGTGPLSVGPQTTARAYVLTAIPAGLQQNSSFTITLWASDGTTTQTEPVPIVIKASCRHY